MKISIVVAVAQNGVIGARGIIPWHIPEDLRRFRKITEGHHVLMGRKTFESIKENLGRPLPKRVNLVLTRNVDYKQEGVLFFNDFWQAIFFAQKQKETELMVIGGKEIYKLALPIADTLYLTRVLKNVEGDTFFPFYDPNEWSVLEQVCVGNSESSYEFRKLERR